MTTRHAYLERFVATLTDQLIVTSVGASARELQALAPRDGSLYRVHLGGATAWGLGLALALPNRRVIVFEGDGGALMGLSVLPVLALNAPPNLTIVVFDNRLYEGGGRLPSITARGTDIAAMARAAGITSAIDVNDPDAFAAALDEAYRSDGPGYIVANAESGSQAPYANSDGTENKYRFIAHVEATEGVTVLQGPARSSAR